MQQTGQEARESVQWYHPGEVVVVARVPRETRRHQALYAPVHETLPGAVRNELAGARAETRSFAFNAPGVPTTLLFLFFRLSDRSSVRAVRDVIDAVHSELDPVQGIRRGAIDVVGAMPHWHTRAHEAYGGGSPGSFPRPVYPDQVPHGWSSRFYQPIHRQLDQAGEVEAPVRVAVLDTMPDLDAALAAGMQFAEAANNTQLVETVEWIRQHADADPSYAV